jgi:hypothetical protein
VIFPAILLRGGAAAGPWGEGDSIVERFARGVVRHRRWVFVVWLVVFLAGGATASQLSGRLSYDFSLPGQ